MSAEETAIIGRDVRNPFVIATLLIGVAVAIASLNVVSKVDYRPHAGWIQVAFILCMAGVLMCILGWYFQTLEPRARILGTRLRTQYRNGRTVGEIYRRWGQKLGYAGWFLVSIGMIGIIILL